MPENDLEDELKEIVRESIPPVVFPDVQKVEVINQQDPVINVTVPEVKLPTITVPEPRVTVEAPRVTVDNSAVAEAITSLKSSIESIPKPSNLDILEALDSQAERLVDAYKTVKVIGGNGAGAQNLWNASQTVINPATEEKQDDLITAIENISVTVPAPEGGATEAKQDDIIASIEGLLGPGTVDEFGHLVTGSVNNQIDIQFYRDTVANLVTATTANGGSASATGGMATFSATTTAGSNAKGVTGTTTTYTAGAEIYSIFTAGWTGAGAGTSYQRIGLYDANNGFFIGFEAGTFKATVRKGGVDVGVAKASFSEDSLTGGASSLFTRAGVPEAIDLTKLNVFRIRFGWVGSAPINFEVLSPDGNWVTFHRILQPNSSNLPHIENADLPVTCDVFSGNSGQALTLITNCWCAGTTQALGKINATITGNNYANLNRSVITGETTAGGGGFVNVKVDPSGAVNVAGTVAISSLPNEGQQTMANSISVAIASNQSAVPISGTVTAQVSANTAVGDGNGAVTTAGTAVQIGANTCKRAIVFNNSANATLANGGVIVVGGSTVVAAEATRRGALIYPGNSMEFNVSNTNLLYIDATDNGAKYHFYYEN